ncbi:CinA family protein [Arcanobacterium bovis]|uniref:CinA family protein n=2 Tax=Arcanobacterium bovis TaxID=2529275 RepID=A0A4Q9V347_9ACTO|nr:CinA family protein [Arcanobacterium bovis]
MHAKRIVLPQLDALLGQCDDSDQSNSSLQCEIEKSAQQLLGELLRSSTTLAVAESLTGGRLADAFVCVPGASAVFLGSAVTYASAAKARILGVDAELLASNGAVDPAVAVQMARGASRIFRSDFAIATTGVAGPGVAEGKPAGTVYVGVKTPVREMYWQGQLTGDRSYVRNVTVLVGLRALMAELQGNSKFSE